MPTVKKVKDLAGQKFGKLLVIEKSKERYRGWITWKCICDCGNIRNVPSSYLKNGHTKSCGCLKTGRNSGRKPGTTLPYGESALNHLYWSYKINAKRRKINFNISLDAFRSLTGQNCYYCARIPKQKLNSPRYNGDYIYNGLDRVDNAKGYEISNVVPCCKTCNSAKGSLSQDEFKAWVRDIYMNFGEES
jgi:hypothetical protein